MSDMDVPESDAAEQAQPLKDDAVTEEPHLGVDVPEADAVEQAQSVPLDEDEERP